MKNGLAIIAILFCGILEAQNVNGFWKGTLTMPNGCFAVNNIELQVNVAEGFLVGDSYHYQDIDYYVKKSFDGSYDPGSKILTVREDTVVTFNIRSNCSVCIKKYVLQYSRNGNREYLTGTWTGYIVGSRVSCETGDIVLTRIKESAFKDIPEVNVDTGTLLLEFYDNAQIDGDSITVLVNKKVVVSNQRLGAKPIFAEVRIDLQNPFAEVEMRAENLGTIPPNTSVLIVTAGEDRYRLFLSSTEEKSARVRFVYRPPAEKKVVVSAN